MASTEVAELEADQRPGNARRGFAKTPILMALGVAFSALIYALYTGHIWEDFFITFRHSQNLVEGKGLVFQEGERVHGFTSPLGVLLPALCHFVTGQRSYQVTIWVFRALSFVAMAGAAWVVLNRMERESGRRGLSWWALGLLMVVEVKAIAFSVSGMETAFLLLFLAGAQFWTVREEPRRWIALGICWAGLMWSRPDGCISIAALGIADLLFGPGNRGQRLLVLLKAAGVCTLLYLPWFIGAWIYYGSPVPHTILAKQNLQVPGMETLSPIDRFLDTVGRVFLPIYHNLGDGDGWALWFVPFCRVIGLFCAFYWVVPVADRWGRACSFAFLLVAAYLASLNFMFPWYIPPAMLLGLITLTRGLPRLFERVARRLSIVRLVPASALAAVGLYMALLYALTAYEMRIQAAIVEMGTRAEIGKWLSRHVQPDEVVFLECVGYIGYFSQAHMNDWPGLVSPRVVEVAREHDVDFFTVIPVLKPDWAVLRPFEIEKMEKRGFFIKDTYEPVRFYNALPRIYQYAMPRFLSVFTQGRPLPGLPYLTYDAQFVIMKRKADSELEKPAR